MCVQGGGVELDAGLLQVGPQRLPLALDPLEVALGPKHEVIARVLAQKSSRLLHKFVVLVHPD